MPRLVERHRVVRYDVRGYGRSAPPKTEFSLVGDLVSVLDQLGLEQVVLVGCSLGGDTALRLAVDDPERVRALVLLCPLVSGFPYPDEPELDAEFEALVEARDVDGLVQLGLRLSAGAGADEAAVAQLEAAVPAWLDQDDYLRKDPPVYDHLHEIQAPTVVMAGAKDRPIVAAAAGAATARIPSAEFIWLPEADHFPALRCPDQIAETVLRLVL
ncbi:alpha/beta fold hydrolase [Kribbella sp. CA-247076]|uniref:alpha/beta fold hydrolase n=1 Tax=Kribbella sp. CA-247076 TaxID=3239941 RepID=UPI003D8AE90F